VGGRVNERQGSVNAILGKKRGFMALVAGDKYLMYKNRDFG
jgi:hypothetical protein